jgi:hypothetical protein
MNDLEDVHNKYARKNDKESLLKEIEAEHKKYVSQENLYKTLNKLDKKFSIGIKIIVKEIKEELEK